MRILLIHNAKLPVEQYGGTERVLWWLAKGLSELGHDIVLGLRPGSSCPYASKVVSVDFASAINEKALPAADITHYFFTPSHAPTHPHLINIHGNGKAGEVFLPNTVFISADHAGRHGAQAFVHNGIDPDDYVYREAKGAELLFLAKASWKVKNLKGSRRIARRAGRELRVLGGSCIFPWANPGVHFMGMVGGAEKSKYLAESLALIFPVRWAEPFGLAVVEALVSGTPALVSPFGAMPEIVDDEVGRVCHSETEMVEVLRNWPGFSSARCRDRVLSRFHYRKMAEGYLRFYEKVLGGEKINASAPRSLPVDSTIFKGLPDGFIFE